MRELEQEEEELPVIPVPFPTSPSVAPDPGNFPIIPITTIPTMPPTTAIPTTSAPTTAAPTTASPTTAAPTTAAPTTASPTTAAPTTAAPTTAPPTTAPPTPPPTHHHHHYSRFQHFEIDSSIVIGFVLVCLLGVLYKKRRKLPLYLMRLKYYLCCCRLSARELVEQQDEHATLNDFLFEVDRNDETGRVNMSGLTQEDNDTDAQTTLMPPSVVEVSIQSIFPDILGEEMERQSQASRSRQQQQQQMREPLLPPPPPPPPGGTS